MLGSRVFNDFVCLVFADFGLVRLGVKLGMSSRSSRGVYSVKNLEVKAKDVGIG